MTGKDFPPTDVQPVDTLALLAAYLLIYTQEKLRKSVNKLIEINPVCVMPSKHNGKISIINLFTFTFTKFSVLQSCIPQYRSLTG